MAQTLILKRQAAKVQGAMCYDFNRPQLFFRIEFCFFQLELWVKY